MFKILIDTCVWLNIAKDYQQQAHLTLIEELIKQNEIEIILPRIVVDEFSRNKERIIQESSRSLSSTFKRVKEVVDKFGNPEQKEIVLSHLNDVDYRIPILGEAVVDTVERIEKLFSNTKIIEISDSVKVRAAQRAIDKRAPFHRQRNSIDDAILIEIYSEIVKERNISKTKFAFISENTKDFSHPNESNKLPHPDIADCFSKIKSLYFINLQEAFRVICPEQSEEYIDELEWIEEPRQLSEIIQSMSELETQVWYNRHQVLKEKIDMGLVRIVEKETFPIKDHRTRPVQKDVWERALKAAEEVEEKLGIENLGPWDDFEWGMINGKLSALRWVLGDEWDMLDT
ncbi:PIN domain-containing protein [Clostridium saccharoperbutylacetonicum]|uniref:PIN domain-containing protein n=1 Tax=Clostridium saccharoperbutylacetonicum TaxID=36745 RepID=UPI0039E76106